ncbi:copper transport protein family [Actinidia rufa]|uniref:Copper transport protein family n=1 Tax=Actinidia rufa TaxID=165716 RepID=A0A7J0GWW5_9ERIC|nr:copper transport protein family [Actinidia rufa]
MMPPPLLSNLDAAIAVSSKVFMVVGISLSRLFYVYAGGGDRLKLKLSLQMAQKLVLKVLTMTDDKTKQKAIEAAADIYGVDSIAADLKDQKLTVIGEMDAVAVVKKLKRVGKVDIISVGPAKEEKKEEKKEEPKKEEPKKEEKKEEPKKDEAKKEDKK